MAKYRQHGYQDSEWEGRERTRSAPRKELTTEERIQKRSLRHAIDRDAKEVLRCHNCGRNVPDSGVISPESACPHCAAPLHCCRTCAHFDTASRWQCRAQIKERVEAKSKPNSCSEYRVRLVLDVTGRRSPKSRSNDPKSQFEDLFKR